MNRSLAKEPAAKNDITASRSSKSTYSAKYLPKNHLNFLTGSALSPDTITTRLSRLPAVNRAPALRALQRTHGNRSVQHMAAGIQAKLRVGQPGDIYEQEADRVADKVMQMPEQGVLRQVEPEEEEEELLQAKFEGSHDIIQRQIEEEEEEELLQPKFEGSHDIIQRQIEEEEEELPQTKHGESSTQAVTNNIESRIQAVQGGGQPLAKSERAYFEPRFGYDFSKVQIHTGAQAAKSAQMLNARAYTVGRDVVFGAGEYAPETVAGRQLLAHELTHVVQQNDGKSISQLKTSKSRNVYDKEILQRKDEELVCSTANFLGLSTVETIHWDMNWRFHNATDYASEGKKAADIVRIKLLAQSQQYTNAYINYAAVVKAGKKEARNQETWINICVGIGAGVLLGFGAAYLLPATAAGILTITASEAAIAGASALVQAGVGTVITSKASKMLSVAGSDLEPGGLHPNVLKLRIWKNVAQLYRNSLSLIEVSRNFHILSDTAQFLIGEIRVHDANGETYMGIDQVVKLKNILVMADKALSVYDIIIPKTLDAMYKLQDTAISMSLSDYPKDEMEQDIWILWISDISISDSNILDIDAIENHLHSIKVLGPGSRLGIDFGWYTFWWEEEATIKAARREASKIRARLRKLEGSMNFKVIDLENLGPAYHLAG